MVTFSIIIVVSFSVIIYTMQLSPSTREEGLAYLQTLFQQMSAAQDPVIRTNR